MLDYKVESIKAQESYDWILHKHYANRIPSISFAFGIYDKNILVGICTYGMPASPSLCIGICGEDYKSNVLELNRVCINDDMPQNTASFFISKTLLMLPPNKIIVSYADTKMNHYGIIYQACNFLYTGKTKERTDIGSEDNTHSRHYNKNLDYSKNRVERSSKYRYVIFTGTRKQKKNLKSNLKYKILPYPKGKSSRYNADYKPQVQLKLL